YFIIHQLTPDHSLYIPCIFFSLSSLCPLLFFFFFFNDTATTEIYTLSLHDALPILFRGDQFPYSVDGPFMNACICFPSALQVVRSEEHTSELQSPCNLVCRLLLEKKKNIKKTTAVQYGIIIFY